MKINPINVRYPSTDFTEELAVFSEYQLDSCFGDGECMRVCPVVDQELTIAELNECTLNNNPLTERVQKFAFDCIQCGQCTIACPAGVQRDILMIRVKQKAIAKSRPKHYFAYFKAKGISGWDPHQPKKKSLGKALVIKGFNLISGSKLGKLKQHVDKTTFESCHTLFYFGCYIFSHTGTQFKTIDIAEKLGLDYEVLGGLKSCCGWPQLLGGRIEEAELLHRYVADIIDKIQPQEIVTGCMECFASLKRMIQLKHSKWQVLTTSQWLLKYYDRLNPGTTGEPITFHDSCHCTRKLGLANPARTLLKKMYDLREMQPNRENALCCGYYNFKVDPELNASLVQQKMEMVRKTGAKTMAVECITCLESYEKTAKGQGIQVSDLVDLVHQNLPD